MLININSTLPGQNGRHSADDTFKYNFLWTKSFGLYPNVTDVCSCGSNWQSLSLGSGNGLVPSRRQAITQTSSYAALGGDGFSVSLFHSVTNEVWAHVIIFITLAILMYLCVVISYMFCCFHATWLLLTGYRFRICHWPGCPFIWDILW